MIVDDPIDSLNFNRSAAQLPVQRPQRIDASPFATIPGADLGAMVFTDVTLVP